MTLQELKNNILNNNLSDNFLILVCEDNYFIADQYLQKLSDRYTIKYISTLNDYLKLTHMLFSSEDILYVVKTDTFSEIIDDYANLTNCIVICQKIDKNILSIVEPYIIKVSKPLPWQVDAYIATLCPTLSPLDRKWLYEVTQQDLYRLTNEIDKIILFSAKDQLEIFNGLKFDAGSDLYTQTKYQFKDELLNRNKIFIKSYFLHQDTYPIEVFRIIGQLLNDIKKIFYIKYVPGTTASSIETSSEQFNFISINKNISKETCIKIINFLTDLEFNLKTGQLDFSSDNDLITYVTCKILSYY